MVQEITEKQKCNVDESTFLNAFTSRWELYDTVYTERYMSTPEDNPVGYNQSSPLWHLDNLRDKKVNNAFFLLIQKTFDLI